MPWRVKFEDGSTVFLDQKDQPTPEQVRAQWKQQQKETPSAGEAFAADLGMSIAPVALATEAGVGAFGLLSQPEAIPAAVPYIGAALGAMGTSVFTDIAQGKLAEKQFPEIAERMRRGRIAHPVASTMGSLAAPALMFEVNPLQSLKTFRNLPRLLRGTATVPMKEGAKDIAIQTGMGIGQGLGQPFLYEPSKIKRFFEPEVQQELMRGAAFGALQGLVYGHPRGYYKNLSLAYRRAKSQWDQQRIEDYERLKDASEEQKAAGVYGAMRAQPEQGVREMPPEERSKGVLPQTEGGVAEKAQVPLTEIEGIQQRAREAGLDEARKYGLRENVEPGIEFGPHEFLKSLGGGQFAANWKNFNEHVAALYKNQFSPEAIESAMRANIRHELVHDIGKTLFPDRDSWERYWDGLSVTKQKNVLRRYIGSGPNAKEAAAKYTKMQLGQEAWRQRIEQAVFGQKSEMYNFMLGDKWTRQLRDMMADTVQKIRESIGPGEGSRRVVEMTERGIQELQRRIENLPEPQPPPSRGGPFGTEGPAARTPEELRLQQLDSLVGRLKGQVESATGEDKANWQARLNEATKERDRLAALIPSRTVTGRGGELITAAAYRPTGGKVETGRHHPEILDRLGVRGFESAESRNTPQFGFQTNRRPFITREQAAILAKRSGQDLKYFEPGEPAHSDEIESPKEPGKAISEEGPAARSPEELRKMLDEHLAIQKANQALFDKGDVLRSQAEAIMNLSNQLISKPNPSAEDFALIREYNKQVDEKIKQIDSIHAQIRQHHKELTKLNAQVAVYWKPGEGPPEGPGPGTGPAARTPEELSREHWQVIQALDKVWPGWVKDYADPDQAFADYPNAPDEARELLAKLAFLQRAIRARRRDYEERNPYGGTLPAARTPEGEELGRFSDEYNRLAKENTERTRGIGENLLDIRSPEARNHFMAISAVMRDRAIPDKNSKLSAIAEKMMADDSLPPEMQTYIKEWYDGLARTAEMRASPMFPMYRRMIRSGAEGPMPPGYRGEAKGGVPEGPKRPKTGEEGGFPAARSPEEFDRLRQQKDELQRMYDELEPKYLEAGASFSSTQKKLESLRNYISTHFRYGDIYGLHSRELRKLEEAYFTDGQHVRLLGREYHNVRRKLDSINEQLNSFLENPSARTPEDMPLRFKSIRSTNQILITRDPESRKWRSTKFIEDFFGEMTPVSHRIHESKQEAIDYVKQLGAKGRPSSHWEEVYQEIPWDENPFARSPDMPGGAGVGGGAGPRGGGYGGPFGIPPTAPERPIPEHPAPPATPTAPERPPQEERQVPPEERPPTEEPFRVPVVPDVPPEAVPFEQRGSPIVPLTAEQIAEARGPEPQRAQFDALAKAAVEAARPDYAKFFNQMRQMIGRERAMEESPDIYLRSMWDMLIAAGPERMARLVSESGAAQRLGIIKRQVAPRAEELEQAGFTPEEATARIEEFRTAVKGRTKLSEPQIESLTERFKRDPEFLKEAKSAVGARLLSKIGAEEPSVEKKTIGFEDIQFEDPRSEYPGFHEFNSAEAGSPKLVQNILEDRARIAGGTTRASNRLLVLKNRNTGEVEVRSTFPAREGVRVYNPPGKMIPITQIPEPLAFHGTILTRTPTQSFLEKFPNIREFNEAIQRARAIEMSKPLGTAVTKRAIPIEALTKLGEGGGITGPAADLVRAALGQGLGELESISKFPERHPLEAPESNALYNLMNAMEVSVPEDVAEMIRIMDHLAEKDQLEPFHFQAMAALMKIAEAIRVQTPGLTKDQLYDATVRAAFDTFKEAQQGQGAGDFIQTLSAAFDWERLRFGPETGQAFRPNAPVAPLQKRAPAPVELAAELPTTPIPSRPFIGPPYPAAMPTATPGTIAGPEMLAESVRQIIESMPKEFKTGFEFDKPPPDITKLKPTGAVTEFPKRRFAPGLGPEGEVIGPTEPIPKPGERGPLPERYRGESPAARSPQEFLDDMAVRRQELHGAITRRLTNQVIKALRDGGDRDAESTAVQRSNRIRLVSSGMEKVKGFMERVGWREFLDREEFVKIRKAVNAIQAASRIRASEVRAAIDAEHREWSIRRAIAQERGQAFNEPEPQYSPPDLPRREDFEPLKVYMEKAIANANDMLRSPDPKRRSEGRKYLESANELMELANWAQNHFEDPVVRATNQVFRDEMDKHLQVMMAAGFNISDREYYVPSVFSGELWNDGMFSFGDSKALPATQIMPRVFANPYEAMATGPYIPVNLDVARLAQHSIYRGASQINLNAWADQLKGIIDKRSRKPVAIAPDMIPYTDANGQPKLRPMIPKGAEDYALVDIGRTTVAVRKGYLPVVEGMMAESAVTASAFGRSALQLSSMLKHGVVLLIDTFHPTRLLQYSAALGGGKWGLFPSTPRWTRGWSALTWAKEDLPRAVQAGLIPEGAMKWALEPVTVHEFDRLIRTTRHDLAQRMLQNGLNATQQADMLYRSAVQKFPVIGKAWYKHLVSPITRFTFDRMTPGFIIDNAITNFERMNARNHTIGIDEQMRMINRDVNAFYGNMGRQGWFANPTFRDLAQIFVLAPMWQEGLIRKEFTAASRLTGLSALLGRRGPGYFGPLTAGMMRGLGAYFLFTQALNLITRGKFTWDNDEQHHEMDAYVPLPWEGKGVGIWISPFSVFAEYVHDYIRLHGTKATNWEVARRVGTNKSGPLGRMLSILYTQQTPAGEFITSTPRVGVAAAKELVPLPISLSGVGQYLGSKVGLTAPPRPGQLEQRGLAMAGMKTEISSRPEQDISNLAQRFIKQNGFKLQPTDEPSLTKLRGALRNGDFRGARNIYQELLKTRTPDQIVKAMHDWSRRPFTDNLKVEQLFLYSLSPAQLNTYFEAQGNKMLAYEQFIDWWFTQ